MAVTLTINSKDDVGSTLESVKQDLEATAAAADKVSAAGKRMKSSLDDTAASAKRAASEAKGVGDGASKFTAMATGITAAVQVARGLADAFRAGREKIAEFAESGLPAFERLDLRIRDAESSFTRFLASLGEGPGRMSALESAVDSVAFVFDELRGSTQEARLAADGLAAATKTLESVDAAAGKAMESRAISRIDSLSTIQGQISNQRALIEELGKTADLTDKQREQMGQRLVDLMNREQELLQRRGENERFLSGFSKQRSEESEAAALKEIQSLDEIEAKLNNQIRIIRELGQADQSSSEEMADERRRLAQLDGRRKEIVKELADEEKKRADEVKRASEDERKANDEWVAKWQANEQKRRDEIRKTSEEEAKASAKARQSRVDEMGKRFGSGMSRGDVRTEAIDIERKTLTEIGRVRQQATQAFVTGDVKGFHEARQQEYQLLQQGLSEQKKLRDRFAKEGSTLEKIKSGFSDQDIAKQVADDRLMKAGKDRMGTDERFKGGAEAFQKGKSQELSSYDQKLAKDYQREVERMQRQINRETQRDFKKGRIGEDEATQATNNLVNQTVKTAEQQGGVNQETIGGLRQAAENQQQMQQQLQQQQEESKAISDALAEVKSRLDDSGGGSRERAMRR